MHAGWDVDIVGSVRLNAMVTSTADNGFSTDSINNRVIMLNRHRLS